MASGPIASWQIDGEIVETDRLHFWAPITADGDCSHEIKRRLLLGHGVAPLSRHPQISIISETEMIPPLWQKAKKN